MNWSHYFYRAYDKAFFPLLKFTFAFLALLEPKVKKGLALREARAGVWPWLQGPKNLKPVWFHVSSGEFEYAKPVITLLKKRYPELPVLVTYFSPSIEAATRSFSGVDFACVVPWDTPQHLSEFMDHYSPRALLIARTDTWPNMLKLAGERSLPTLLFSATITRKSGRMRPIFRGLTKLLLAPIKKIYCVSQEDFGLFAQLGLESVTQVRGDTRYDQVRNRLSQPRPLRSEIFKSRAQNQTEFVLVAGSTWAEDEAVLLDTICERRDLNLGWVLVPHEPHEDHLLDIENRLSREGIACQRYSHATHWNEGEVLLIDQLGILAELYLQAQFAFVGGSFKKTVHSVMEPLAAGCVTFVGPLHDNNREALEFKQLSLSPQLACVNEVRSAAQLGDILARLTARFDKSWGTRIQEHVQTRSGASESVVSWIEKVTECTSPDKLA